VRWLHLNRPAAALLGAVGMVTIGALPFADAYASIDLDVLVFLLGLMILVGHLELGGFFEAAAAWMLRVPRTPRMLLVLVVVGNGLLSALFVVTRGLQASGAVAALDPARAADVSLEPRWECPRGTPLA
jgi:Na+/H+ antiporter NhaD/arsenite permease-like protein